VHGPSGTDGVGPNVVKFKTFHPYGGAEGGALQDLGDVFGGHNFVVSILAEHAKALLGHACQEAAYRRAVALTGQNMPGTLSWVSMALGIPFFLLLNCRVTLVAARSDSSGTSDARRYICAVGSSRQKVTLLRQNCLQWLVPANLWSFLLV
jgi:hypothetical protein